MKSMCQVAAPQFEKTPTKQCRQEKKHMYRDQPVIERKTTLVHFKGKRIGVFGKRLKGCTGALQRQTIKLELQFIPECFCRAARLLGDLADTVLLSWNS